VNQTVRLPRWRKADQAVRARPNIEGAILYGPNSGGLGYGVFGHDMVEAALRLGYNTTYYPDSDAFTNIGKWPAFMLVKGSWDDVEGLEGSLEAYRRAREQKEFFVLRGPRPLATQSPKNTRLITGRMPAFAMAAVLGHPNVPGAHTPADLRRLFLSSPNFWGHTNAPVTASSE